MTYLDLISLDPSDNSYKNKKDEPKEMAKSIFEIYSREETDKFIIRKKSVFCGYECMKTSIEYWQEIIREVEKLCK